MSDYLSEDLEQYKAVISKVISLASIREPQLDVHLGQHGSNEKLPEGVTEADVEKGYKLEEELLTYLHGLDIEAIKVLQAIRYIGDDTYNSYEEARKELDLNWNNDNDIEIANLTGLVELSRYLRLGCKKLILEIDS